MRLAARGSRNLDRGEETIEDMEVLAQVRRQARRVHFYALLTAIALTVLYLVIV